MTDKNAKNTNDAAAATRSGKPKKIGPVLGGTRRMHRGPLFKLFFFGGYRRFYPAPAGLPWWAVVLWYVRVVMGTALNAGRPISNMFWLMRWCVTGAVLLWLVIAAVTFTGALLGVPGWGS